MKKSEAATRPAIPLAELLSRSMEDDGFLADKPAENDRERWDEDEGSFGG